MLPVPEFHAYLDRKINEENASKSDASTLGVKRMQMTRQDRSEQERNDRYGRFGNRQARLVAMQMDFGEEG
jgi:hypothetical protein